MTSHSYENYGNMYHVKKTENITMNAVLCFARIQLCVCLGGGAVIRSVSTQQTLINV
jgi:hypothetical protein